VADRVDALPYLEDVFVVPDFRNLGIGTALLEAAERAAAARGDRAVSLAVSTVNSGARRLYARLGYVDAGIPVHHQPTSDPVAGSQGRAGSETVMDLVKRIDRLAAAMRAAGGSPGQAPAAG
jgi:hypothetical protein